MHAAVVELDALADAVRPAAQDHDLVLGRNVRIVLRVVGGVVVAGVLHAGDGNGEPAFLHAVGFPRFPDLVFLDVEDLGEVAVGEAVLLGLDEQVFGRDLSLVFEYLFFQLDQFFHLVKEPAVDLGRFEQFVRGRAFPDRFIEHELSGGAGRPDGLDEGFLRPGIVAFEETQTVAFVLKGADGFLEGFLVVLADTHHFANGAHLRSQLVIRAVELLEGPARELHDHIVAGWDVLVERTLFPVGELVKRYAGREVGGDEGDGEASRFGSEGGGAGSSRVDLDDHHAVRYGVVGELDVRAAYHLDGVHDVVGIFLQSLLQGFGDRHHRRGAVGVAGVHAHGVDVLDEADGDLLALGVADDLKLQLFPAGQAFLDQYLMHQAFVQAAVGDRLELFHVVDEAAAGAAHCVGRADDDRELDGL